MKKTAVTGLLTVLILLGCGTKKNENRPTYRVETYKGTKILVGEVSPRIIWEEIPEWKAEYMIYQPDSAVVQQLKQIDTDLDIVCVMGIWCPDSRAGVPSFLKALDEAQNPHLKITLFAVDRDLKDPQGSAEKYKVNRVPTFIVLENGKEIGRMIEIPKTSFEADLLDLWKSRAK